MNHYYLMQKTSKRGTPESTNDSISGPYKNDLHLIAIDDKAIQITIHSSSRTSVGNTASVRLDNPEEIKSVINALQSRLDGLISNIESDIPEILLVINNS